MVRAGGKKLIPMGDGSGLASVDWSPFSLPNAITRKVAGIGAGRHPSEALTCLPAARGKRFFEKSRKGRRL
jgi:hypothetical protein